MNVTGDKITDTIHSVTCPQGRRVITRRAEQKKWRKGPRWKRLLTDHAHIPEAECAVCHRKHGQIMTDRKGEIKYDKKGNEKHITLTINHTDRICYLEEELYLVWNPAKMRVECTTCNWMYEQGKVPCPDCLKKGIVVYIKWDQECCDACYYEKIPEVLQRIIDKRAEQRKADKIFRDNRNAKNREDKAARPCVSWRIGNTCVLSGKPCKFTPSKMLKMCLNAVAKKKFVKFQFPCRFKLLTGRCSKSRSHEQCTFSRVKCLRDPKQGGCPKARARVKEEVKKA